MDNKSIHIDKTDNYRIVVISDVHGHVDHLVKLLEKVKLKEEDYLVILGDFINKGPKIIETFEFVKTLRTRKNTIILKGNHESFMERPIRENDHIMEILDLIKSEPYEMIWLEWAKRDGFDLYECKDSNLFRAYVQEKRADELEYLGSLPILLYFDEYLFVHGGYEKHFSLKDNDTAFLKFDCYDELATVQEKKVIVGHFPACNLRGDVLSNKPYFNDYKNIITIDGGLGVKPSGELNAFIIEKKNGHVSYDLEQVNDFKDVIIKKTFSFEQETPLHIKWPDRDIELVKRGDLMSKCLHVKSNSYFTVFNDLIHEDDGRHSLLMDYANNLLEIEAGKTVKLVKLFETCAIVKHKDEFGWIRRDQIDLY